MTLSYETQARMFKAFCDPNRLYILSLLKQGETCACVLLEKLQISQPTLSHHMKILCDSGVVTGRREGKWVHYSLCPSGVETVENILKSLLSKPD